MTKELGHNWLQWQQYAAEWLAEQNAGIDLRLKCLRHFFNYLNAKAPYAVDVATMFKGHPGGHKVSTEEFEAFLVSSGSITKNYKHISSTVDLCNYILKHHLSAEDDNGVGRPLFPNPFEKITNNTSNTETVHSPLPVIAKLLAGHTRLLMTIYYNKITPSVMADKMKEAHAVLSERGEGSLRNFLVDAEMRQIPLRAAFHNDQHNSVESVLANRNPIGWEERATGLCLVGGNTVRSDELSTVGGCWNGGPIVRDSESAHSRVYGPVPHGPENCPRCRWHITDATYLPALNSAFNQVSYKAHQAAELSVHLEGQLEALKDELFIAEETGAVFLKHNELQAIERRYEKQRVEADEYAKDCIAIFNLINRVIQIENGREEDDDGQKLIAVGSDEDLKYSMKFVETDSELLHLALLCEDAEFHPDLHDDLRKTPAIAKRTNALSRMMARSGYKPVFLEMDEQTQLIAGNALMRKMAKIAAPEDRLEGYRIASNYIEAQEFLKDDRLLKSGFDAVKKIVPITLPTESVERIPALEVEE
ncbi:hypothetical protein KZP93_000908 [Shigella flexneri]|nr:hypothetical protein [Shigella flexneri]